jgi:hypothetical protein
MQSKNAQIKIESRLLHRSTQEGPEKFILYFHEFPTDFYEFWNFIRFSVNDSNEF